MVRRKNSASKKSNGTFTEIQAMVPVSPRKKIAKKQETNKWTDAEYSALILMVRQYGEDWPVIASKLSHKTAKQCMQKFKNSQRSAKKGNWALDEDEILLRWVSENGATKWTECSKLIKGRCGKQCRERWVNILNPQVKKGNWSEEEQNIIFENLYIHHTSWSSMSKVLEGRTENSIKNYFYSSLRRLKSNPLSQIIKNIYVDKEASLKQTLENSELIKDEMDKLNPLSQKICKYLLNDGERDEQFIEFLIGIMFTDEGGMKKQSGNKFSNKQKKQIELSMKKSNVYVPQTDTTEPEKKDENPKEAQGVIAVLKRMADQANKPSLHGVINFLEMQLANGESENVIDCKKDAINIRLPFCWNCKNNKNCIRHGNN